MLRIRKPSDDVSADEKKFTDGGFSRESYDKTDDKPMRKIFSSVILKLAGSIALASCRIKPASHIAVSNVIFTQILVSLLVK